LQSANDVSNKQAVAPAATGPTPARNAEATASLLPALGPQPSNGDVPPKPLLPHEAATNRQLLAWMFGFLKPVRGLVVFACLYLSLWVLAEVMTVRQMAEAVNHIQRLHHLAGTERQTFWAWTWGASPEAATLRGVLLGLAAGAGFGLFFVGLDATPAGSGLWPLLAGRVVSVALLAVLVTVMWTRNARLARTETPTRGGGVCGLVILCGVFDTVANVLFLLSARLGDLGVSAVLVSLYPVVVVLLARVVLRERLSAAQLTSAGLALTASALLSMG